MEGELNQKETLINNLRKENEILKKKFIGVEKAKSKENSEKIETLMR
jgi:hypothetical protein